jgi:hypothetical protein
MGGQQQRHTLTAAAAAGKNRGNAGRGRLETTGTITLTSSVVTAAEGNYCCISLSLQRGLLATPSGHLGYQLELQLAAAVRQHTVQRCRQQSVIRVVVDSGSK